MKARVGIKIPEKVDFRKRILPEIMAQKKAFGRKKCIPQP